MAKLKIPKERLKDLKEEAKELDRYHNLAVLHDSEGGKELKKLLVDDVVATIDTLATQYKEATHTEILALCANFGAKLALLRILVRSKGNKEALEAVLEKALEVEKE